MSGKGLLMEEERALGKGMQDRGLLWRVTVGRHDNKLSQLNDVFLFFNRWQASRQRIL